MHIKTRSYLPGDKTQNTIIGEIIRVDHSGEYGAQIIYSGQILATKHLKSLYKIINSSNTKYDLLLKTLKDMYDSEVPHYEYFQRAMNSTQTRPSFLLPLWSFLGFVLGYMSGLAGQKSAMALTVGIEEVIGHHYKQQLTVVSSLLHYKDDILLKNLHDTIKQFMYDELEHLNTGIKLGAKKMCGHLFYNMLVKFFTRVSIFVAKYI